MDPYAKLFLVRLSAFFIYLYGGSSIFMLIEKGEETENPIVGIHRIYTKMNMTNQSAVEEEDFFRIVYKAASLVCQKPRLAWNYNDCINYGLHILTTIGYGTITPITQLGQMVTIIYAIIGIPLTLLTLRSLAWYYNKLIRKVLSKCFSKDREEDMNLKVVIVNIAVTVLYVLISAAVSVGTDRYNYPQGIYVWFITITTVGLGDFVPQKSYASEAYNLLIGLSFMSGTIDAMVTYFDSNEVPSLRRVFKRCCLCCGSRKLDLQVEEDVGMGNMDGAMKDVGTQTDEFSNFGFQNSAF